MAGRYSDEEAKEILRRALEQQELAKEGFQHEDLVAAAKEVGLDEGAVEQAAIELADEREALATVRARRRKARRRWVRSAAVFAVVNAFLFLIDLLTPGGPWFFWPLLGWGLFVVLHGLRALPPPSADTEREEVAVEKGRRRRAREQEARRRAREAAKAARGGDAGRLFEESVERGVAALVNALAHQLEKAGARARDEIERRSQTGFEGYVDAQRRRARRAEKREQRRDRRSEEREERRAERGGPLRTRVDAEPESGAGDVEEEEIAGSERRGRA